ncbi:MAG: YecA family protein [Alcanivoracaceae bacterium]|jgi:uncharacterized protein|nr:YecA family protein [Alcanivoracaceae bacterium]
MAQETADYPSLRKALSASLSRSPDSLFSFVEAHGLATAMAVAPSVTDGWQDQANLEEDGMDPELAGQLEQLRQRLASQLGFGESITLPCRLDPFLDDEGNDLCAWCFGFISGVLLDEESWYAGDEEAMAHRLLPMLLFSGLDDDEALDALWQDEGMARQLARAIPEMVEELFLYFHAPDEGSASSED